MTAPRRKGSHTRFCQWREKGECTCGSGAIVEAPRREGLSDDDLDAIEAQLDSSVPYYVPTLVRMAREALVLRRDAEQGIHPAEREVVALRTAAREYLEARRVQSAGRAGGAEYQQHVRDYLAADAALRALVAQEDR